MLAEGAKIEASTSTGWTPLFYAVCTKNVAVVKVTNQKMIEALRTDDSTGSPARRRKHQGDRHETKHRAPLRIAFRDRRDSQGPSSLEPDSGKNSWSLQALIDEGANLMAVGEGGQTPLHLAAQSKDAELVKVRFDALVREFYGCFLCRSCLTEVQRSTQLMMLDGLRFPGRHLVETSKLQRCDADPSRSHQ